MRDSAPLYLAGARIYAFVMVVMDMDGRVANGVSNCSEKLAIKTKSTIIDNNSEDWFEVEAGRCGELSPAHVAVLPFAACRPLLTTMMIFCQIVPIEF